MHACEGVGEPISGRGELSRDDVEPLNFKSSNGSSDEEDILNTKLSLLFDSRSCS